MGQSISRRNPEPVQLRYDATNPPPPEYNAHPGYQNPYHQRQPAGSQANRQQQYVTYPTQYPDQYPYGRYGPTPRQPVLPTPQMGNTAQQTELQQTKTIRNQVNLKKPTLRIVFRNKEKTKIMPTFTFDASAPCSVTLFFLAKEENNKGCKLTARQPPGPRAFYEKGLAQVFPPQGDEAAADAHTLDLTEYNESELMTVTPGRDETFPIVIRLETVTDKGGQEGHSLQDLEAGSRIPAWVQSQTTYARLVKEEDGSWEARAVKQKIWVEGISYELQEIYGIQDIYSGDKKPSSAPVTGEKPKDPMASYASEDLEGRECVICLSAVRDTTVLPCRHMCMCEACARELQRQQVSRCPICRDVIESLLHIKRPDKKAGEKGRETPPPPAEKTVDVA
ncbi:hypothetical protein BSKO_04248 [Bryopsis sp. KO-2023]|nr:hypothetical protein BSKO_04248 [Bryopsis sp. KO-2023]